MKAVSRIFAIPFLFVVLGLALTGCGGDDSSTALFSSKPATPTNVKVIPSESKATVSWNPVAGAKSYNIYYTSTPEAKAASGKIENATSPYEVTGLTNGLTYYFTVTAVNAFGESGESPEQPATPNPGPAPPIDISTTAGDGQITVNWETVADATSYNIYYGVNPGVTKTTGTKIANATSPLAITGLANGTTYYVVITAENASGESIESSEMSATPSAAPLPPGAPTGVTAAAGDRQATVSWTAVAGATSYNIYFSTSSGVTKTTGTKIANVSNPQTVTGLTNGITYYFVVTAVDSTGESKESTEKYATPSATILPPARPSGVSATPGNSQVTVSWNPVASATSYNIYYSKTSPVTKTSGSKISNVTSPHVVAGLTNGTTYYFVVTAVGEGGESAESIEKSATPVSPPAKPTGASAFAADRQAVVYCEPVAGATSYNLYYSTTAGVSKTSYTTKITGITNPYTVTSLLNGTTYYFVMTAVNAGGESLDSSESSATPSATPQPPPSPTGVSLTAGTASITVTWNTAYAATSYNIYYAAGSKTTAQLLASGPQQNVAAIAFGVAVDQSYTITGLTPGTTYSIVVTAVNAAGESGAQNNPKKTTAL
jgi:fibronectin type 3 domain-containing protein